jgi:exopolysaccharide biosynthesis polyprenyl glycosylphosphotransferase
MNSARHKTELLIPFVQLASDGAAVVGAFLFSYWLRFSSQFTGLVPVTKGFPGFGAYALSSLVVFFVWAFVFKSMGMYGPNRNAGAVDELWTVLKGVTFGMLIVTSATFFYRGFSYSRVVFVLIWAAAVIFIFIERVILIKVETRLHQKGKHLIYGLIAGSSPWSVTLLDRVRRHPEYGLDIVGYMGPNPLLRKKTACMGSLRNVREIVERHRIDAVFVAMSEYESALLEHCMHACAGLNIAFYMIPHSLELMSSRIRVHEIGGVPVLKIKDAAIMGWNAVFKRVFDIIVSTAVLVLASPLMVAVAAGIKLGSKGPILYKQERVGLDGRGFDCLKFRTMYMDAESRTGPVWAKADDPRVTPFGRILRRFSIDELPQLGNVLSGEMSLVGPRPERPHFVEQFKRRIPKYLERHRVRSGMTGWAQVNGLRGNVSIDERTKYDVFYVENWSLLFDIKIILKTVVSVISGENSY